VRGDGGYVLVPPARVNGAVYAHVPESGEDIQPLPEHLIPRLVEKERPKPSRKADTAKWLEGERNDRMFRLASSLRRAGKPKSKKSWMMLGIAVAVACGGKALGQKAVDQGTVLYLSLEDVDRRLRRRLDLLECEADLSRLHYATAWPRLHQSGKEALEAWITAHSDAGRWTRMIP
jgi:hypothetical protein